MFFGIDRCFGFINVKAENALCINVQHKVANVYVKAISEVVRNPVLSLIQTPSNDF